MKWETLKRRVADDICYNIERGCVGNEGYMALACAANYATTGDKAWQTMRQMSEAARRIVDRWDIRMVGKLRELFPNSFPRNLRAGPLVAELDANADWIVRPK